MLAGIGCNLVDQKAQRIALSAEIIRWPKLKLTPCGTVSCSFLQSSPAKSAMSTDPILVLRHKWSWTCYRGDARGGVLDLRHKNPPTRSLN